jgi:hypothetical protein
MTRRHIAFVLIAALFAFITAGPPALAADSMTGVWEGEGIQDNNSRWSIKVTVAPGRVTIDYPSLNCGGILEVVEKTGSYIRAEEKLGYGLKKCINGGLVILLEIIPGQLDFFWYYPDRRLGATGVLKKTK